MQWLSPFRQITFFLCKAYSEESRRGEDSGAIKTVPHPQDRTSKLNADFDTDVSKQLVTSLGNMKVSNGQCETRQDATDSTSQGTSLLNRVAFSYKMRQLLLQ